MQIFLSLAFFNHYNNSIHHDTHDGNFLYYNIKNGGCFHYKIFGKDYYLNNNGILILLWDFGRVNYNLSLFNVNHDFYDCIYRYKIFNEIKINEIEILIKKILIEIIKFKKEFTRTNFKNYIITILDYFVSLNLIKEIPINIPINYDKPYIIE